MTISVPSLLFHFLLLLSLLLPIAAAHGFMNTPHIRGSLVASKFVPETFDSDAPRDHWAHFPAGNRNPKPGSGLRSQIREAGPKGWTPFTPLHPSFKWRAGVCGDEKIPGKKQPHLRGGQYYYGAKITATYRQAAIIHVSLSIIAHHNGFMELHVCDVDKCDGEISESCFRNGHCQQLNRAPNKECDQSYSKKCGPIDRNYPGRWYLPCSTVGEDGWEIYGSNTIAYRLPTNLTCEHCVLQWFWTAANTCNPPGVIEYFDGPDRPKNWGNCEGQGGAIGGVTRVQQPCGPHRFPEEYLDCADIRILPHQPKEVNGLASDTPPNLSPSPVLSPTPTYAETPRSLSKRSQSTTPRPSSKPSQSKTPRPSPKPSQSLSPRPSPKPSRSNTPRPSPKPSRSNTPRPSPKPSRSNTPRPSPKPSRSNTPRPSPKPSRSNTPRPSPKPSRSNTPRPSPKPSRSNTPRPSPKPSRSNTPRLSPKPSRSNTPRPSPKPIRSNTPRPSPKPSRSNTPRPSPKPSRSNTPRPSPKPSRSNTPRPSLKPSRSNTPRPSPKPSRSNTPHPSPKPSRSSTPRPSPKPSRASARRHSLDPVGGMPTPIPSSSASPKPSAVSAMDMDLSTASIEPSLSPEETLEASISPEPEWSPEPSSDDYVFNPFEPNSRDGLITDVILVADGKDVSSVTNGDTINISAYKKIALKVVTKREVDRVDFYINGERVWTEHQMDYFMFGNSETAPFYWKNPPLDVWTEITTVAEKEEDVVNIMFTK